MRQIAGIRFLMGLVDFSIVVVLGIIWYVINYGGDPLVLKFDSVYRTLISIFLIQGRAITILPALIVASIIVYFAIPLFLKRGHTIGSFITFSKVRQPNARNPEGIQIVIRAMISSPLIMFILMFLFALIFTPLNFAIWTGIVLALYLAYYSICMTMIFFRYDLQTPHDILSDTVVVSTSSSHYMTINNSLQLEKINDYLNEEKIINVSIDRDRLKVSKSLYDIVRGKSEKVLVRGNEKKLKDKYHGLMFGKKEKITYKIIRAEKKEEKEIPLKKEAPAQ